MRKGGERERKMPQDLLVCRPKVYNTAQEMRWQCMSTHLIASPDAVNVRNTDMGIHVNNRPAPCDLCLDNPDSVKDHAVEASGRGQE